MQPTFFAAILLCFVSSSLAYLVNAPNGNIGINWHGAHKPQTLKWSRVDTDARSFAVVLTNQDRSVLHQDIVIADYVDGTAPSAKIYPPRGGFPTGSHFRANLVKSKNEPNTIYAQSNEFTIYA